MTEMDEKLTEAICEYEYENQELKRLLKIAMDKLGLDSSMKCPRCGEPLYLSDVKGYDYVCIECDENFY